ncbi:hypothetical protein ABQE70_01050 [Xanthomonas campestris pv. campestris]|uniref:hypothetical protein n=1 Tax=Xanthomonas campestris TaxID=339 RepID=UPI002367A4C4|nr:hypothetical protein [Xanthomonas campestris]WDJ83823.1 hypothetical protein JH279_14190 [Xanthomonas campestris pv. incanae]WDJ96802.1 hypothetical protein JH262_14320 [Xanthomonas campestris pv. incanae]
MPAAGRTAMPERHIHDLLQTRQRLERDGWPRLQMSAIVMITASGGLLSSHLLRNGGIDAMVLRYPLATLAAYGVFLLLMRAWVRWRNDMDDAYEELLDHSVDLDCGSTPTTPGWTGGGSSSGAGRSGTGGAPAGSGLLEDDALPDFINGDAELPVLAIVALLAASVAALVAAVWVVWSAPVLMAELLVDAALAGGLYRRMRGIQAQGWWWLCVRHTIWPLLGVLVFFIVVGAVAQHQAPEATTLMEAVRAH